MVTMDFWLRKTEVEIEGVGIFRSGLFDGVQNDLDIEFKIGSDKEDKSFDEVAIYNMSDENRTKLTSLITDRRSKKLNDLFIYVSSGYQSNFGKIMWGRIRSANHKREPSGDVRTEIKISSVQDILDEIYMTSTYHQGDSIKKFFNDISIATGFPVGEIQSEYTFNEDFPVDATLSIMGWIRFFENRTEDAGDPCKFSKQFEALNFIKKGYSLKQTSKLKINPTSGLLDATEFQEKEDVVAGWNIVCFLIPGIFNGLEIELESDYPKIEKKGYVVKEFEYRSSSSNHEVEMKLKRS